MCFLLFYGISSERHAYAAAPDTAIVGKGIALLVEDVVDAEVGAELVAEFLRHNEVHETKGGILINGSPTDRLRISIPGDPVLPERCVPAVPRVIVAELQACPVAGASGQARVCLIVPCVEIGVETAQGKAAAEILLCLELDALNRCIFNIVVRPSHESGRRKSRDNGHDRIDVDEILHLVVEIGEFAEGLAAFSLDSDIKVECFFGLQIGISNNVDIDLSSRRMTPVKVQLARGRCAVGGADVRLEAQALVDLVSCAEFAGHLAAEYVVVVPADGRDDRPARTGDPFVLDVERRKIHRAVAELIGHALKCFGV